MKIKNIDKELTKGIFVNSGEDEENDEESYEVEDELKVYSDKRKERQLKKRRRRRRVAGFFLVLLIGALLYFNWGTLAPASVAETAQSLLSGFGKSKFPVDFTEGTLKAAVPVGSNIGILTDTSFLLYSQNGDKLAVRPHGINNPAAVSGGGKAVIFDRGGKQFRVETRYSEPFYSTAAYDITSAAIGGNGYFCIITEADNYLSELTLYDNSYKNIFKWDASNGRVLAAAISPDGKKLAASCVGARNGVIFSDIYLFNIGSTQPVAVKKYDGQLLYSLHFKDNSHFAAVGDTSAVFLDGSGKQTSVYPYGDNELECTSNGDGPCELVFKNGGKSKVVSLNGEGKVLGSTSFGTTGVTLAAADGSSAVAVSSGKIWHFKSDCSSPGVIPVSGDVLSVLIKGSRAYVFGTQSIGSYNLS